jgi:hypothetical protein
VTFGVPRRPLRGVHPDGLVLDEYDASPAAPLESPRRRVGVPFASGLEVPFALDHRMPQDVAALLSPDGVTMMPLRVRYDEQMAGRYALADPGTVSPDDRPHEEFADYMARMIRARIDEAKRG